MEKRKKDELVLKRTVKDSVFTDLFSMPEYLLELYRTLHPEDKKTSVNDLMDITLKNILSDDLYNDLGFRVKDKQLILVECQSTWSINILIRAIQYLMETYNRYIDNNDIDLYTSTKAFLPQPELYVIFTGEKKDCPDIISLKDDFFNGEDICLNATIKVITYSGGDDIINHYIRFAKVITEQIKIHGRTKEALMEALKICEERGILKEYLESRRGEVMDIYSNLFDQEVVIGRHIRSESRKAEARGEKRGEKRGELIGRIRAYDEIGMSASEIAERTGQTVDFVEDTLRK